MIEYVTAKELRRRLRRLTDAKRDAICRFWKQRCAYCGKLGYTMDHVVPISRGGRTHITNLVLACRVCNNAKGGLTLDQFARALGFDPAPRAGVKLCAKRGTR